MAITEEARFQLFEKLRKALGAEEAATLMEHLPPVGWADVATRRDVDHLEATMHLTFATKDDLRAQTNRMIGWLLASQATLLASISVVVALR